MTVRELINELLDNDMNKEVCLYLNEPHTDNTGKVSGYIFKIDKVNSYPSYQNGVELEFTDWRKKK